MNNELNMPKKTRTQARIVDAFFELYKENPIDKISVKAIVSLAGCHRSTFYEYFDDIYDILHKEEAALFKLQQEKMIEPLLSGKINILATSDILPILVDIFNEKGSRIITLIGDYGDPHFQQQFKKNFVGTICKVLNVDEEKKERIYLLEFAVSGIIAVISRLNVEKDINFNDLANFLHTRIIKFLTY